MKSLLRFYRNAFSNDEGRTLATLPTFGHFLFAVYRFCRPQIEWWGEDDYPANFSEFDQRVSESLTWQHIPRS